MLECELCDYLMKMNQKGAAKCSFTGVIFSGDPAALDIEYPCRHVNFNSAARSESMAANVNGLCGDDWRYLYRREHVRQAARKA